MSGGTDVELRTLERALAADPADAAVLARRGRLLARIGRPHEAASALDLAARLSHDEGVREELGTLLDGLSQKDERLGIVFRFVPGGPFLMGSEEGDDDERPPHLVRLRPFFMAERVLFLVEKALAGFDEPYVYDALFPQEPSWEKLITVFGETPYMGFHSRGFSLRDTLAAGRRLDASLDIPTEAQWERVRRASELGLPYGIEIGSLEWTRDFYASDAYDRGPVDDPAGPGTGTERVVRGVDPDNKLAFTERPTWRDSAMEDGRRDEREVIDQVRPIPPRTRVIHARFVRPAT